MEVKNEVWQLKLEEKENLFSHLLEQLEWKTINKYNKNRNYKINREITKLNEIGIWQFTDRLEDARSVSQNIANRNKKTNVYVAASFYDK